MAQEQQATELDRISVTGSRIQTSQTVTASAPVAEISAAEFKFSGTTRVEDLINQYPQMAAGMDSFTVNPSPGFPTANLRGLGTERTLVLVNGQRLPPGGIRSEARDLSQVPSALVKRVDVLTGGASAVYGADAVAGVVNFILDTDFEGISANIGYSGYQHKNDNRYLQWLMDADERDISYPTGSTGLDGIARNFDIAFGGKFAEGRGHAMGWVTWRENEELRQAARDYSSCPLNPAGTACDGSPTSPEPRFNITRGLTDLNGNPYYVLNDDGSFFLNDKGERVQRTFGGAYHINPDGTWGSGAPAPHNYAPINHYQRPDKRITFGSSIKYEVSEQFKPYLNGMFAKTNTKVQIAESGTFFSHDALKMDCTDPLLRSFCADTNRILPIEHGATVDANGNKIEPPTVDAIFDPNVISVLVGKRNVEGGPRISELDSSNFHLVGGVEGAINDFWNYNLSVVYGRNSSTEVNINDFVTDRIVPALLDCANDKPTICYNVWDYNGVTAEQARDLAGVGMQTSTSIMQVYNGYVTGAFDWSLPSARGESIGLAVGFEHRRESYARRADTNMAAGNFAGLGGPRSPINESIEVDELFLESQVPLFMSETGSHNLYLDLGYRYSDYSTSGTVNTYKIGFAGTFADNYRLRGGFNRAIRAPNTSELFSVQNIALFRDGGDPCAPDADGKILFTLEQCRRTGMSTAQYGQDVTNPAGQYNHFTGGNPDLKPEEADTWTLGFVATPIADLSLSMDFYDIKIKDQIGAIGAGTILRACGLTGDTFLCDRIHRSANGDLWVGSSIETGSGYVENLIDNFGEAHFRGVDFTANYGWGMWNGWMSASFTGTHIARAKRSPLPGINDEAAYDCAGIINGACGDPGAGRSLTPDWKHIVNLRYSADAFSVGVRWRHTGALDYRNQNGSRGTTDQILVRNGNKLKAMDYLDLSGSYAITGNIELSGGVNNIFDKSPPLVGGTMSRIGNAPIGYDQLGRFLFANLNIRF